VPVVETVETVACDPAGITHYNHFHSLRDSYNGLLQLPHLPQPPYLMRNRAAAAQLGELEVVDTVVEECSDA
jgi:hypothetical protein